MLQCGGTGNLLFPMGPDVEWHTVTILRFGRVVTFFCFPTTTQLCILYNNQPHPAPQVTQETSQRCATLAACHASLERPTPFPTLNHGCRTMEAVARAAAKLRTTSSTVTRRRRAHTATSPTSNSAAWNSHRFLLRLVKVLCPDLPKADPAKKRV